MKEEHIVIFALLLVVLAIGLTLWFIAQPPQAQISSFSLPSTYDFTNLEIDLAISYPLDNYTTGIRQN